MVQAKTIRRRLTTKESIYNLCAVASLLLKQPKQNPSTRFAIRTVLRSAANKSCASYHGNDNKKNCAYISIEAAKLRKKGAGRTVADHAVPISEMLKKISAKRIVNTADLTKFVCQYSTMVLITTEEDNRLRNEGLANAMPTDWNGVDKFARYKEARIKLQKS